MNNTDIPDMPTPAPSWLDLVRARRLPLGRRGLILLGVLALGLGAAFNWSWLVAVGAAPLLLSVLPCAAMCALGLCMSRTSPSSTSGTSPTKSDEAAAPDGTTKVGGSCCAHGAETPSR